MRTLVLSSILLGCLIPAPGSTSENANRDPLTEFTEQIRAIKRVAGWNLVQVVRTAPIREDAAASDLRPGRIMASAVSLGEGAFLTCATVVGNEAEVDVVTRDGTHHPARVVGVDRRTNIAVLHSDETSVPQVRAATESLVFPGQLVVAVGFGPQGGPEASFGTAVVPQGPNLGYSEIDMMQVTAPLYPGAVGGMLLNQRGEMVGLVCGSMELRGVSLLVPNEANEVAGFLDEGRLATVETDKVSLALPAARALEIAAQLQENGFVERGYLGLSLELTEVSAQRGTSHRGVMVHRVVEDGPAARAGLLPGDVILEYAEAQILNVEDLSYLVRATRPGSSVKLQFLRRGSVKISYVRIEQAPEVLWGPEMDVFFSDNSDPHPAPSR